jgi:hypothetical protein
MLIGVAPAGTGAGEGFVIVLDVPSLLQHHVVSAIANRAPMVEFRMI